jgi:hypothetical protein
MPSEVASFLKSKGTRELDVQYILRGIPIRSPVEVHLRAGEKVTGLLVGFSGNGFDLDNGQHIAFSEVLSIHTQLGGSSFGSSEGKVALIIIGAILAAILIYCATGRCSQ